MPFVMVMDDLVRTVSEYVDRANPQCRPRRVGRPDGARRDRRAWTSGHV